MLPIENNFDYLPLWCLLASLVMVAVLNTVYARRLRSQLEGFVNSRYVQQIHRDEGISSHPASLMMILNAMLTTALTVYLSLKTFGTLEKNNWLVFFMILGGIAVVILYFVIVPALIRFLFNQDRGLYEHRFNFILLFQVMGLILVPVVIIAAYSSIGSREFLYVGLVILALVYLYKIIRGVIIGISNRISLIYIILYLCTLEILPIVVLVGLYGGEIS